MYTKSEAVAQQQNKPEPSIKEQVAKPVQIMTKVGDHIKCPECEATGRVVWVSQDKKTMGVQCPASHRGMDKVWSKYEGTIFVPSPIARKNVVFLRTIG